MKSYEVWNAQDPDGGGHITPVLAEQVQEWRSKGLIEAHARLLFQIQADTYEEALAVKNVKLGWSPYIPNGEAAWCPKNCGGVVYPEGFAECPNCGVLSGEQLRRALAAQQAVHDAALRPVVKSVDIVEAPGVPMMAYAPVDPTDFCCAFNVMIGPADGIGAEQVPVVVCSTKWLSRAVEREAFCMVSTHPRRIGVQSQTDHGDPHQIR